MLDTACRLVLDEVTLAGSAPGGKVEFKRTLIISFLFKFYLEVSQSLKREVSGPGPVNRGAQGGGSNPCWGRTSPKMKSYCHILLVGVLRADPGRGCEFKEFQGGLRPAQGFA